MAFSIRKEGSAVRGDIGDVFQDQLGLRDSVSRRSSGGGEGPVITTQRLIDGTVIRGRE